MKEFFAILLTAALFASAHVALGETLLDFDGDHKTDFAYTRNRDLGNGSFAIDWFANQSLTNTVRHWQWGLSNDPLRPFDYDGDGKTDIAVIRFSNTLQQFVFYILNSSNGTARIEAFGISTDDLIPIGDYDGDAKADLVVYRKSTMGGQHYFIYRGSLNNPNGNLTYVPWGSQFNYATYNGDFDGDGKFDFCIHLGNVFFLRRSSDLSIEYITWGQFSDIYLRPGDFDADGKTDFLAVRNNGTNFEWYVLERDGGGTGAAPIFWGSVAALDFPLAAGDYDGDGRADMAVFRNSATFFVRRSSDAAMLTYQIGSAGTSSAIRLE